LGGGLNTSFRGQSNENPAQGASSSSETSGLVPGMDGKSMFVKGGVAGANFNCYI